MQPINCQQTAVIEANAAIGYGFVSWSDGDTNNPRFIQLNSDSTLIAIFDKVYSIAYSSEMPVAGSVAGSDTCAFYGDVVTLTAISNHGYHFIQWNDGDTNNPRVITLTQDTVFTAKFAKNWYTLTGLSADTIRGSVTGSETTEYLDTVTLTATANYGFHFTQWNDSDTSNPRVITLTQDTTFTALFAKNSYDITLSVDTAIHGSVSYTGDAVNLAADYVGQLLSCAEYGAGLNFTFMYEDTKVLQDSVYSGYYAASYQRWKQDMLSMATRYESDMAGLNTLKITGHEYLTSEVTRTVYEDGTYVLVNYSLQDYDYNGNVVPARDYAVVRED